MLLEIEKEASKAIEVRSVAKASIGNDIPSIPNAYALPRLGLSGKYSLN
jgi:hypothetical protein